MRDVGEGGLFCSKFTPDIGSSRQGQGLFYPPSCLFVFMFIFRTQRAIGQAMSEAWDLLAPFAAKISVFPLDSALFRHVSTLRVFETQYIVYVGILPLLLRAATPYFVIHRRTVRYWVPRVLLTAPLHPVPPATGPRCLIGEILGWDIQEVDWGCSRLFPVRMCNLFIFVHSSLSCRRITHSSAETFRKLSSRFQTQLARKVSPFFFFLRYFVQTEGQMKWQSASAMQKKKNFEPLRGGRNASQPHLLGDVVVRRYLQSDMLAEAVLMGNGFEWFFFLQALMLISYSPFGIFLGFG